MLTFIRKLIRPPQFPGDEDKERLADIFNTIILLLLVLSGGLSIADYFNGGNGFFSALMIFGTGLVSYLFFRLRQVEFATKFFLGAAWLILTWLSIMQGGLTSPIHYLLAIIVIIATLLYGTRGGALLTVLSLITVVVLLVTQGKTAPEFLRDQPTDLRRAELAGAVFINIFVLTTWTMSTMRRALEQARGNALQLTLSNRELTRARDRMEERVNERTSDLQQRAAQLQISAEIGRAAAGIHALDQLLPQVAALIGERFGFYHAAIFLIDDNNTYAEMKAASSPGGRRMVHAGFRLSLTLAEKELPQPVQAAILTRKMANAVDAGQAFGQHHSVRIVPHPDLVNTRSELALPLVVGETVLGALDIHSDKPGAFSEEDSHLQVLADQVAISIENARLFIQNQQALEAARQAYSEISREVWLERMQARPLTVKRDARGITAREMEGVTAQQLAAKPAAPAGSSAVAVPITVRGFPIGYVNAQKPAEAGRWTTTEQNVLQTLVEQLGQALDGARLYEETQERAQRERLIAEVAGQMRETLDLESVVQTATREIYESLHLHDVTIRVGSATAAGQNEES